MVRVKICGITTPGDARLAAEAGADAVGLNFLSGPRKIDVPTADAILDALPPDNVAQVIRTGCPAWVNTCSGVEQSPGKKDPAKMRAFVQAAKSVAL